MITINAQKLPLAFPKNQIMYIEKEYNEFYNECFSNETIVGTLLSYFDDPAQKHTFLYIPALIEQWKQNQEYLGQLLSYHYPFFQSNSVDFQRINAISTASYTNFLLKIFENSDSEQIQNGLLVYSSQCNTFFYLQLQSQDISALLNELKLFSEETAYSWNIFETNSFSVTTASDISIIADEIRERIIFLMQNGHEKLLLKLIMDEISSFNKKKEMQLLATEIAFAIDCSYKNKDRVSNFKKHYLSQPVSPMIIDENYRIILPDYNNLEIKMTPLVKAVYFLFLKYPNGILFKELSNYKYVLQSIYNIVSLRENLGSIEKSIDDICNPLENSINEKCSRIKESFLFHFENDIAMNYYITGERGCPKFISIDRKLITCHDTNLLNL